MPKEMSRNGNWRAWALGVVTAALMGVVGTLFGTWRGAAADYGSEVAALRSEVANSGQDRRQLDQRITRLEENMGNIDKSLEQIDRRLGAIEKAVR